MWDPARQTKIGVHVIVAETLYGPRPLGLQAAHTCRNRACYFGEHVSWRTIFDNVVTDRKRDGTFVPPPH